MTLPDTFAEQVAGFDREHPENVYHDGGVRSWEFRTAEGNVGRYGIIQPGFEGRFGMYPPEEGSMRIYLYEPESGQVLRAREVREGNGKPKEYELPRDEMIELSSYVPLDVTTPPDQGEIAYIVEFVEPGRLKSLLKRARGSSD